MNDLWIKFEAKRHQKPQKHWILFLRSSFTVVTFKIFFPKFFYKFANWTVNGVQYRFHEKLVALAKFLKSDDFKTAFQKMADSKNRAYQYLSLTDKTSSTSCNSHLSQNRVGWHQGSNGGDNTRRDTNHAQSVTQSGSFLTGKASQGSNTAQGWRKICLKMRVRFLKS